MEKTEISKIADTIKGHLSGNKKILITGVSIDSRTTKKGDIFFAIKGENLDGHDFVKDAVFNGAAGIVVQSPKSKVRCPVIVIKDTVKGLQDLAKYYRNKFNVKVIGITGSNGKTTTKDILRAVLSQKTPVLSTQGNFNNHIGLPLTLFQLEKKHRYCVLEMGTNHKGEIACLCKISSPSVGIVTNIGTAHICNFGSLKNILKEKTELFNSLGSNGIAVMNNDDEFITSFAQNLKCKKITFGMKNKADVTACDISLKSESTTFSLQYPPEKRKEKIVLPVAGLFNVYNALAAASAAVTLGYSFNEIAAGIRNFVPPVCRMETINLKNGIVIVNDSYNANPTSMRLAIENFAKIFYNNRKILVLGDMLELGEMEIAEHKKIGEFIKTNNYADNVLTVGDLAKNITAQSGGVWFENKNKLSQYLKKNLKYGDAVFFKASRKIALEDVVNSLMTNTY
ncbi:MAG: UDP-N-acetylmuramoyl-tripeptide--D-alanyl-D-alanine ligase [Elusimicrobia bacterium CG06_land_8_20_14_3_00_38_11]|nr:MAG: UDP-N-acetylmuramoyl-tripeptide--D-alanyl-D-alanine ligase [Elusimicrobia bacterium CG06_land_8_20_14_3_00_38_11]